MLDILEVTKVETVELYIIRAIVVESREAMKVITSIRIFLTTAYKHPISKTLFLEGKS